MVSFVLWVVIYLWCTGKLVIMDIGFSVLRGILNMSKRGVYGSALIKIGDIVLWGFI